MKERLQKIIARSGFASRRKAEELITSGRVTVNNLKVTRLGTLADHHHDEIRIDGKSIPPPDSKLYIMLNKPRGYVTSLKDPAGRPLVTDLLIGVPGRVYPVGRLDYHSEGLLLFTNDGDFALRLTHPRYLVPKTYRVKVQGKVDNGQIEEIRRGLILEDGPFKPLAVELEKINRLSTWLLFMVSEGRNRIIRRAMEKLGFRVARLVRISIGSLNLGDLPPGHWRHLSKEELAGLKQREEGKTGQN